MLCLTLFHRLLDIETLIAEPLKQAFPELQLEACDNLEDAKAKIYDGSAGALILELDFWPEPGAAPEPDIGLAFLRRLRNDGFKIPALFLLNPDRHDAAAEVQDIETCDCVYIKIDKPWLERIPERLRGLIGTKAPARLAAERKLRVDIYAKMVQLWEFRFVPKGWSIPDTDAHGVLYGLDEVGRKRLIMGTRQTERAAREEDEPEAWRHHLELLGISLMETLFRGNSHFFENLVKYQGLAGGKENTSIRFILSGAAIHLNAVALEALYDQKPNRFLMLDVPIYRSFDTQEPAVPEMPAENRMNFLILECNTSGWVDGEDLGVSEGLELEPIPNVASECENLEALLWKRKRAHPKDSMIGLIERVRQREVKRNGTTHYLTEVRNDGEIWRAQDLDFTDFVMNRIAAQPWHALHYAGHSHYHEVAEGQYGRGFLFFPGRRIRPVSADDLAHSLRNKTQFIFCNSCYSAHEKIVYNFAQHNVPAIMGFRWKVDDELAPTYAELFYERLLNLYPDAGCFERALLSTQQDMESIARDNLIWAAGVLMMQRLDA